MDQYNKLFETMIFKHEVCLKNFSFKILGNHARDYLFLFLWILDQKI